MGRTDAKKRPSLNANVKLNVAIRKIFVWVRNGYEQGSVYVHIQLHKALFLDGLPTLLILKLIKSMLIGF